MITERLLRLSAGAVAMLVASLATPFVLWALDHAADAKLFVALTVLLWFMHRGNIARLMAGTEGKIGKPAASGA